MNRSNISVFRSELFVKKYIFLNVPKMKNEIDLHNIHKLNKLNNKQFVCTFKTVPVGFVKSGGYRIDSR